jgi:excisionase family DNA binding protein
MNEILAVSVAEAARRLGVSHRTVGYLMARGELYSRKIGRRRVIPVSALERLLRPSKQVCSSPKRNSARTIRDGCGMHASAHEHAEL